MNADSIAGTVTAVLCVVVGLLIIGSALVPIVEHASVTETETEVTVTEEVTGSNSVSDTVFGYYPRELTITVDGSTTTVNGEVFNQTSQVKIANLNKTETQILITNDHNLRLNPHFTGGTYITLTSGTLSFSDGNLSVTGTGNDGDYTSSKDMGVICITDANGIQLPDTDIYCRIADSTVSSVTIGDGQMVMNEATESVTMMDSEELPEGMTMTMNDNATATVTLPADGIHWVVPMKWIGFIETTETETTETASEYAPLYAIIPIMLILSMAYVLIRRF